ncbi:MAG: TRAP transporter fused permease subunit [Pirellulaceae bacterium]
MTRDTAIDQGANANQSSQHAEPQGLLQKTRRRLSFGIAVALSLFVLVEVNFSLLTPLKELSLFVTAGLVLCFLQVPIHPGWKDVRWLQIVDAVLAALAVGCCGYLIVQGVELGQRAAVYTAADQWVGAIGLVLVIEAARRAVGWSLPILAFIFIIYAHQSVSQTLPEWLFPHRGQDWEALIGQTYLRTEGVFGTAVGVMFRYVFLFVLFGAFLQASGATGYIIGLAVRLFGKRAGGPAKVSVIASGLMGSLSGSAVANAATTGTFTIPLMRSIGFKPHIAAGVEAAASSGGALVPPVMGAGAYMMLEIINRDPAVTYLEICQAAFIPACLYYLSIFMLVHFYARKIDVESDRASARLAETHSDEPSSTAAAVELAPAPAAALLSLEGLAFFGSLGGLMGFLLVGFSPFRAVTYALAIVIGVVLINPATPVNRRERYLALVVWALLTLLAWYIAPAVSQWGDALVWSIAGLLLAGLFSPSWWGLLSNSFRTTAQGGLPLIVAAACVGIVIGLVSRTGVGTGVPQAIIPLAGNNLFLGLVAIMFCSLVLGMGLPSAVSYLLLATIIGPVFADPSLGVPILAAHLFIFYFGMMAMVTPPVALAAYATASIAHASVMQSGIAAFRFSLVGFTLPFMFVYRPALCLMGNDGGSPLAMDVVIAVLAAVIGVVALSSAMAGFLFHRLGIVSRILLYVAASCALFPDQFGIVGDRIQLFDVIGAALLLSVGIWNWKHPPRDIGSPVSHAT